MAKRCAATCTARPSGDVVRIVTDSIQGLRTTQQAMAVNLHLAPGLAGTSGPLGLASAIDQSIAISTTLDATDLRADMSSHNGATLQLAFNNEIDLEILRPLISVEPKVPFQIESAYHDVRLVGDFKPATRYAVTIAKSPAGGDPAKFPHGGTLSVFVPDLQPSVWLEHDQGYLGSHGNRALLAHAVNIADLAREHYPRLRQQPGRVAKRRGEEGETNPWPRISASRSRRSESTWAARRTRRRM